jgi:hypothetical protein
VSFKAAGQGSTGYEYQFWLWDSFSWSMVQGYSSSDTWMMSSTTSVGFYTVQVNVRSTGSTVAQDATARITNYQILP